MLTSDSTSLIHLCLRMHRQLHLGQPEVKSAPLAVLWLQTTKTISLIAAIALGACNHVSPLCLFYELAMCLWMRTRVFPSLLF